MERLKTGLKRLDKAIMGGFPPYTNILVSGGAGSGKTLFALKFLFEGAKRGEKCCYISFNENKDDIIRACVNLPVLAPLKKYIGKNLQIIHINFNETMTIKKFVRILEKYPETDRIVIDNVNKLLMFADSSKKYRMNLSSMLRKLKEMKTSILICETNKDDIDTGKGESFECDGVIHLSFLDYEEKPIRMLNIYKLRYTKFDPLIPYEFIINDKIMDLGTRRFI